MTRHDAERKVKILDFIAATLRTRGYPPSVREIATRGRPRLHVRRPPPPPDPRARGLPRAGSGPVPGDPADAHRRAAPGPHERARAPVGDEESHLLPVIGEIAAGGPIEAYQDASETMAVPELLAPSGDAYVLQGPRRLDDRGAHRRRRLRPHPAADHGAQRRHRRRPGRGERRHPQALLQGEGQASASSPPTRRTRRSSTTTCGSRASSSG